MVYAKLYWNAKINYSVNKQITKFYLFTKLCINHLKYLRIVAKRIYDIIFKIVVL